MRAPFILFVVLAFSGCAKNYLSESEENYLTTLEPPAAEKSGTKQVATPDVQKRELVKYIVRISDSNQAFTQEDVAFYKKLPQNPAPGSFHEAATVVGALRMAMLDAPSLEAIATEKGIDVANALERNAIIKNFRVYHLAQQAVQKTKNSDSFNEKVTLVIQTEARTWASLIPIPAGTPAAPTAPEPATAEPPKRRLSTQDLRGGDSALMEADQLAEAEQFKEAIDRLSGVSQQDPYYPAAQEKIRLFSNRAVQSLRQRAAKAFQNSISLMETNQKVVLLEEAKKLLEEALTQYPSAEQLGTVQENLAVINRDLKNLGR